MKIKIIILNNNYTLILIINMFNIDNTKYSHFKIF